MNMDELFAMGFCKAAEEHGVDPAQLAKFAGWFGIGRKKTETFDPSQRKDLVAVSNDKGTFYVPRAWDEEEPPAAWLKDTGRMGKKDLSLFLPKHPRITYDYGSPASTTNSPHATWQESWPSLGAYRPRVTTEKNYWKSVVLPDKSRAYVPASDEALRILKTMAGPAAQVRE